MRLGLNVGYSGSRISLPMELVHEADRLGFHSAWTAEAYGSDAVTPAAWIAAQTKQLRVGTGIMQMPARTPAMTAMTAMTLDQLSGGRFLLGLGPSGPQVVEGWHGVAYGKPLVRTREYVVAARGLGMSEPRILWREILPNAMPPVITQAALHVGGAILIEAGLAFLGLGDPNVVSWGALLNDAQKFVRTAWWLSLFPGVAITLTVLALNVATDGLNEAWNRRL
jgi:hypothetical protein